MSDSGRDSSERDPALGYPEDFPDEAEEKSAQEATSVSNGREQEDSVIGIPLSGAEDVRIVAHPSWGLYWGDLLKTGLGLGVLGTAFISMHSALIEFPYQAEVGEYLRMSMQQLYSFGIVESPSIIVPWWVWAGLIVIACLPTVAAYLKRRYQFYIVTTHRVMSVRSFPDKYKDTAELGNINSVTSYSPFLKQQLGIGTVEFQPANGDTVYFVSVPDYEWVETAVKQIGQKYLAEGRNAIEEESNPFETDN